MTPEQLRRIWPQATPHCALLCVPSCSAGGHGAARTCACRGPALVGWLAAHAEQARTRYPGRMHAAPSQRPALPQPSAGGSWLRCCSRTRTTACGCAAAQGVLGQCLCLARSSQAARGRSGMGQQSWCRAHRCAQQGLDAALKTPHIRTRAGEACRGAAASAHGSRRTQRAPHGSAVGAVCGAGAGAWAGWRRQRHNCAAGCSRARCSAERRRHQARRRRCCRGDGCLGRRQRGGAAAGGGRAGVAGC